MVITLVAGSIPPLSRSFFQQQVFTNEISSSALLDIQLTLHCVCKVDSFIPESEDLIEKRFHCLFSKKKTLKSRWCRLVVGKCLKKLLPQSHHISITQ